MFAGSAGLTARRSAKQHPPAGQKVGPPLADSPAQFPETPLHGPDLASGRPALLFREGEPARRNRLILGQEHWRRGGPLRTVNQPPLEI